MFRLVLFSHCLPWKKSRTLISIILLSPDITHELERMHSHSFISSPPLSVLRRLKSISHQFDVLSMIKWSYPKSQMTSCLHVADADYGMWDVGCCSGTFCRIMTATQGDVTARLCSAIQSFEASKLQIPGIPSQSDVSRVSPSWNCCPRLMMIDNWKSSSCRKAWKGSAKVGASGH